MADPIQPFKGVQQVAFNFWRKPVLQANDGTYYCPGVEGATYLTNPWDFVAFGTPAATGPNIPSTPGAAVVTVTKFRDVDKKKAAGNDGGRITIHGIEPAEVEIRLTIWTPEQLRQLLNLWPFLFPTANKGTPPAYDVSHPLFTIHDIKSVQFVRGEGPMIDQQGRGTFTMRAIEFLKPGTKKATKTEVKALGSINDPGAGSLPTPGSNPKNTAP